MLGKTYNKKGFTLIELLIVIAIISIIAAVVFVALDPLTRFRDARDSSRWSDISGLLSAVKIDQVDNGGSYLSAVDSMTAGEWYMIVDGATMTSGCADNDSNCDQDVSTDGNCVDMSGLVSEGYLGSVPVSPAGEVTWDSGSTAGDEGTGYVIKRDATGIVHIQACESENSDSIVIAR
ncbi:MAG TPA: prepilin-type N-terminal cleavage/methylation domain-containing protein [Patescibacteria group bacterium]|nr:prepilin-type N-terminal cleavage/methylation domain-containing protein [Patescibacteria group bacterium]